MSEREMELAEYLKALRPNHVRALVIQNGRLLHEREAFKTTIAALSSDHCGATKKLDQVQIKYTALQDEAVQLRIENVKLRNRLGIYESGKK